MQGGSGRRQTEPDLFRLDWIFACLFALCVCLFARLTRHWGLAVCQGRPKVRSGRKEATRRPSHATSLDPCLLHATAPTYD